MTWCWRWELTPAELFAGFHCIKSEPAKDLPLEVRAFAGLVRPLEGTALTYQFAVTDRGVTKDMLDLREAQPSLPISGDRRSGVLVFDGPQIVGACVIQGIKVHQGYKMVVHPEYRNQGLAFRMLLEWCRETRRPRVLPNQGITLISSKALLSVHTELVAWAVETGRYVPPAVRDAVAEGAQARTIIQEATRIEQLVLPPKKTSPRGFFGKPARG